VKIAMFTNTYLPHVTGVSRSVDRLARACRRRGHEVLVVAPTYRDQPRNEPGVVRIPAIPELSGTDFSLVLPLGLELADELDSFRPQLIHSHYPFLLGNTAVRAAASRDLPLVFTYHTMYEHYTHYVPLDIDALPSFARKVAAGYANLCDRVIAPSESTARILRERGVESDISVVPTGVDLETFADGDGGAFREKSGIPGDALLLTFVGRIAPEKNVRFLAAGVAEALTRLENAHFLAVGSGPAEDDMNDELERRGVAQRAHFPGVCEGAELVDAYHATDAFVFASKTETQGVVLVEAMAAGCPVVALDAPGVREVVRDGENGYLLDEEDAGAFADAIERLAGLDAGAREAMRDAARRSAEPFEAERCVDRAVEVYREVIESEHKPIDIEASQWAGLLRSLKRGWSLWSNQIASAARALLEQAGEGEPGEPAPRKPKKPT
jgi:glycosyltransferase involved in cell wall biosynthesis